jgi:hypothetical protein
MRRNWLICASALLLAGCSGASDAGSTQAATSTAGAGGDAGMSAYVQCLSEHGVQMPTGGPLGGKPPDGAPSGFPTDAPSGRPTDRPTDMPSGMPGSGPDGLMGAPPGVDDATWQAARDACSGLAPAGRPQQDGSPPPGTGDEQYAVFWTCMSDHDVTAPTSGLPTDLDPDDPTVAAALTICDALLPAQVTG